MILWSPIKCLFETILPSPISPWPKSSEYRIIWRGQIFCWPQRSIFFCRHWSPLALEFSEQPQDGRPHLPTPGNPTVHQRDSRHEAVHHAGENLMFVTTWIFLHLKTGIVFFIISVAFPIQDLKNPTASFVQLVYIRFLQDFGFNTGAMLVPSMELMESLDHPEVPTTMAYFGSIS